MGHTGVNCFDNPWGWPGGHEPYPPDFPHWLEEPIEYPPGSGILWWEVDIPPGNWSTGDKNHPIYGPPNTPWNTFLCWLRYLLEKTKIIKPKKPVVMRFKKYIKIKQKIRKRGF